MENLISNKEWDENIIFSFKLILQLIWHGAQEKKSKG